MFSSSESLLVDIASDRVCGSDTVVSGSLGGGWCTPTPGCVSLLTSDVSITVVSGLRWMCWCALPPGNPPASTPVQSLGTSSVEEGTVPRGLGECSPSPLMSDLEKRVENELAVEHYSTQPCDYWLGEGGHTLWVSDKGHT